MPVDLRRGRPPKTTGEPRTAQFNIRARPSFRAKLAEAAQTSGRSLSEEAEARIEQSFAFDQLFGDTTAVDFMLMLGGTFALSGRRAAELDGHPEWSTTAWRRDPWCFESAAFSVMDALWQRHPAPGKYWGSFRDNWMRRLFARGAIRCGKTAADDEELQIKLTRADLHREGELP
jgi:hypothetical protein